MAVTARASNTFALPASKARTATVQPRRKRVAKTQTKTAGGRVNQPTTWSKGMIAEAQCTSSSQPSEMQSTSSTSTIPSMGMLTVFSPTVTGEASISLTCGVTRHQLPLESISQTSNPRSALTLRRTLPALASAGPSNTLQDATNSLSNSTEHKKKNKTKEKKTAIAIDTEFDERHLDMSTSPEASKTTKKRRKKSNFSEMESSSSTKKSKKAKQSQTPVKARKKPAPAEGTTPPTQPAKGKCLRCREKGIKCNEAKPTCNQCHRGLWTCQYEQAGLKKRSKNGCLNCRARKRKCTEEKPSCAYCLKVDDDCEYAE